MSLRILLLMFFFSFADLILNAGFEHSAYTSGTFDTRGTLSSSPIRFLKGAVGIPSLMILLMFLKYYRPIYVYIWIFVFVVNNIPSIMSPGSSNYFPLFLFLDLLFFNNVIEGNYYTAPLLRDLRIRRDRLRELSFLVFPILSVLLLQYFYSVYLRYKHNSSL